MERKFSFINNEPLLYLISTPIGNLNEFSIRAQEACREADFIACEDTRNTSKLLSFFNIKTKTISVHEHNEKEMSLKIIELIKEGKKICYLSDAGYPGISDPGSLLVSECLKNSVNVSIINGSSAFLSCLLASGLDTSHFYFHGFLDARISKAKEELETLKDKKETLIFYESPHRIMKTLTLFNEVFKNRKFCIGRELTKLHEEFIRGTLDEISLLDESTLIGEMVIVIEGNNQINEINDSEIEELLIKHSDKYQGRDLIDFVSSSYKIRRNKVYSIFTKLKK